MSMELIKPGVNIDFVGKMKYAMVLSAILILIGIGSMIYHGGFNLGIDFAGGEILTRGLELGRAEIGADHVGAERRVMRVYH